MERKEFLQVENENTTEKTNGLAKFGLFVLALGLAIFTAIVISL